MNYPYIWIVQFEYRSTSKQWYPGMEGYQSRDDAEDVAALLCRLPKAYRKVNIRICTVQTPEQVAATRQANTNPQQDYTTHEAHI